MEEYYHAAHQKYVPSRGQRFHVPDEVYYKRTETTTEADDLPKALMKVCVYALPRSAAYRHHANN